ncbi:MAG: sensor histidine kinase [Lachnospiraceae bacterium]|nr:sensor histidine kinase [Lachnospiraceae bacterium]
MKKSCKEKTEGNPFIRTLIMLLLLVVLILLSILILLYAKNSTEAMKQELYRKTQLATEQAGSNVDNILEQVEEAAFSLVGTIYPYLNQDSGISEQITEYADICRTLNEYINKHKISFLRIYVPDSKIYKDQISNSYSFYSLSEREGALQGLDRGGISWQGTHAIRLSRSGSEHEVVTCAVAVKRLTNYDELAGILCADVKTEEFTSILQEGTSSNEHMYLVDENGQIFLGAEDAEELSLSDTVFQQIQAEQDGCMEDKGKIYAFDQLKHAPWYVVSTNEAIKAYTMDGNVVRTIVTVWIAVFLILMVLVGTMFYSRNMNRTVQSINLAVRELADEKLGEALPAHSDVHKTIQDRLKDQLASIGLPGLEQDAAQIVLSIHDIVDKRYKDQLAISEYRMESLQAQIKPHFLYNTLDALKWMIMDEQTEDAVWMVNALSRYLRMSINKGEQIVSLEEEIRLMRTYIEIMQKRFQNKFEVFYELEQDTLQTPIPKLSLQPLVENALLHGILHCDRRDLRLTIRSWRADGEVVIQIEDNGCGMEKEQAERLQNAQIEPGSSYGVANVRKRLELFEKGNGEFLVESRIGAGTCITIKMQEQTPA